MTPNEIARHFPNASKAFIDANSQPLARLDGAESEQGRRKIKAVGLERSEKSVAIVITIVSFRRRRLDGHDNIRSAHKPLADRITEQLEFASDDDPRLRWEYEQVITRGSEKTLVKITLL